MEELKLVRLRPDLESAFREMQADFASAGEPRHGAVGADFRRWVERLSDFERGVGLPDGWVAGTSYFLQRSDGKLLGTARLRHRLTPALWQDGGHIGYDIRPSERNRGYATRMLALVLEEARARGLSWVLLTVDPENTPSIRVMVKNGGYRIGVAEETGLLRFRIDIGERRE